MLPASKNEFPKFLYLDQNKWIDLARAHYGRHEGRPFENALLAVRRGVANGKLVVPFSVVNAVEAMTSRDAARRERLVRFIVDLSDNLTVMPDSAIRSLDIRNLLRNTVHRGDAVSLRPRLRTPHANRHRDR